VHEVGVCPLEDVAYANLDTQGLPLVCVLKTNPKKRARQSRHARPASVVCIKKNPKKKIPKNQRANLDTQGLPLVCVYMVFCSPREGKTLLQRRICSKSKQKGKVSLRREKKEKGASRHHPARGRWHGEIWRDMRTCALIHACTCAQILWHFPLSFCLPLCLAPQSCLWSSHVRVAICKCRPSSGRVSCSR